MSKEKLQTQQVNEKIIHLLVLNGNTYSINLTEAHALELGLSNSDYQRIVEDINKTNEAIKEAQKDTNHELQLFNPADLNLEALRQTMPSGTLSSNGQEQVGDGFFAPNAANKVNFLCKGGGALTPAYTCRTRALGGWISKTAVGTSLTWTSIDVNLDASNTNVSITFQTTDSNGGTANWKAMS